MRINHNIAALNTFNQLLKNNNATNGALEKLSSGLRINRAGDDPAGMAISEKMRAQIKGLNQASRNAQDGISLIQTVEGALNETTSILQRMRELAVQAGNETATAEDRTKIQAEVDKLAAEITRIADTTKFNGQSLMSEEAQFSGVLQIGADSGQVLDITIDAMGSKTLGVGGVEESKVEGDIAEGYTVKVGDLGPMTIEFKLTTEGVVDEYDSSNNVNAAGTITITYLDNGEEKTTSAITVAGDEDGNFTITGGGTGDLEDFTGLELKFQFTGAENATATITVPSDKFKGINVSDIEGSDVKTVISNAIDKIDTALDKVSAQRSDLGSYTNRLEHTITNLETSAENMTASESRIRDVDMAAEMMEFTKMNVLSQAAQAMLAQANAQPQSVLQLLNG